MEVDNLTKTKSKINTYIRYFILALFLWAIPGFTLVYLNGTISSVLSQLSFALILLYIIINGKSGNNTIMLIFGALYFLISSLVNQAYMPEFTEFIIIVVKYFIVIWGGYEVMKDTSSKEMWFFMLFGSFSILGNMFLFNDPTADYGRYSGFYLDPNNGGVICLIGYALTYVMPKKFRLIGKLIFTILGLFTFSRTFILSWVLINLVSIRLSIKNAKMLAFGFGLLSILLVFNEFLPVKNRRLEQIGGYISGNEQKAQGIDKDSRWTTWSRYYDALQENPIFGNGYKAFTGNGVAPPVGVHNTYLLIWGESGIIPIFIFLYYIGWLLIQSNRIFTKSPHLLMMTISLCLFLMTNHNFLTNDYSLLLYVWIYSKIKEQSELFENNSDKLIV
jgi:hypothetical protein